MATMSRVDVLRVLFQACQYEAVLAAPRPLQDDGSAALLRVRSLIELERFDEAMATADVELIAPKNRGDLQAAKARAASFAERPLDEVERLNQPALACGVGRGSLNQAWMAISQDDFHEARRALAAMADVDEPDVRQARWLYELLVAAHRGDLGAYRDIRERLHAALAKETSLHRWAWGQVFSAKASCVVGDWDATRASLADVRTALMPMAPCLLHTTIASIERTLARHHAEPHLAGAFTAGAASRPRSGALATALARKPMLGLLYRSICRSGSAGIDKEQLIWDVWSVRYDPFRHDHRFYKSMQRLREELDAEPARREQLITVGDRYFIEVIGDA